ncbi:MAG: DUF1788 domain-containing protein [Lamprobacter sp.]|uniref:DUF1788 domain-containing protein n=1 Tax=Lamprobacter sp. TaxID=3100796 RepID=UPI002B25B365|nr:DUF1788 domain-containing protein [Lamprobacter sp.]MEA3641507.1 DUF1788 domain-containing protein [Lamprobacter sp.]
MTPSLFDQSEHSQGLQQAMSLLRRDLIHPDGPRISTMRNYRFAILQYRPEDEFKLRAEVQRLSGDLIAHGWVVLTISLQALLMQRIRAQGDDWLQRVIARERRTAKKSRERGLNELKGKLAPLIEGPDGLAADCSGMIRAFTERHPDQAERTLALIGRAGALYPFFRSSALLRHLDGNTGNVPVVLLYPGQRHGQTGLSFMGKIAPDSDYRPRIYA